LGNQALDPNRNQFSIPPEARPDLYASNPELLSPGTDFVLEVNPQIGDKLQKTVRIPST
jgi:hypothetical protein